MTWLPDLRLFVPEWVGISGGIVILLIMSVFFSRLNANDWSTGFIIVVAAILRMTFLWRSPELSDDMFRYVFDGMMLLSGHNPFAAAPGDVMPENPVMLNLIMKINHTDLPTIYPPAAQLVFAAGASIGGIFGMKLVLVLLDLLSCILIIKILAALNLPRNYGVLYAWHPLPVIEIAASGHVDAAAVFFTFSAIFLLLTKKTFDGAQGHTPNQPSKTASLFIGQGVYGFVAGIFFAATVLTKWIPLIWMPGMLLLASPEKRKFFVYGFLICFATLCWMFLPDMLNCFYTLAVYVANWEFSGFAFRWLRIATGSGTISRYILAAAFMITIAIIYNRYHRQTAAALKIPLNPPLSKGDTDIFKELYAIAMAFLFFTPTLHPWYGLYLAALLPFAAGPAGIAFSWSIFLAYRVVILYGLTGEWVENDFIAFLIVSAPAIAFAAGKMSCKITQNHHQH
jgi:hypothetical protein